MIYDHRCDFNNYINDIEETFEKEEFTSNISKKNLLELYHKSQYELKIVKHKLLQKQLSLN